MANITVSTSSNMDDPANLALGNGEQITITNNAILTVDSDHKYSQQAANPKVVFTNVGTKYFVDGKKVWWIPFDASSGNVPALSTYGTTDVEISSVGVGEFLGVWANLGDEAPMTAGTALPTSGYVKLREKTGTIADNDVLTFTNNSATVTVNSATGGQRGWIRSTLTDLNYPGEDGYQGYGTIEVDGDWFELGTSDGTTTQTFQFYLPTITAAVQVETGAGTGVYEWWCNYSTSHASYPNAIRGYTSTATGLITFTKAPPNGAKVRVPNVYQGSFYNINATYPAKFAGVLNVTIKKAVCWGGFQGYQTSSQFLLVASATDSVLQFWVSGAAAKTVTLTNCASDYFLASVNGCDTLSISNCYLLPGRSPFGVTAINTKTVTITDSFIHAATGEKDKAVELIGVSGGSISNTTMISGGSGGTIVNATGVNNFTFNNVSFCARTTAVNYSKGFAFTFLDSNDIVINGVSKLSGDYGTNTSAYGLLSVTNCYRLHVRNIGTASNPYESDTGATATKQALATVSGWYDSSIYKVFHENPTISGIRLFNVNITECDNGSSTTGFITVNGNQKRMKFNPKKQAAKSTGPYFFDAVYNSETSIAVGVNFCAPYLRDEVDRLKDMVEVTVGNEQEVFPAFTNISEDQIQNKEIIYTWNYYVKGINAFNTFDETDWTVINNLFDGNYRSADYYARYYQIDNRSGWSAWKSLTGANISGETPNPAGCRLRFKLVGTTNVAKTAWRGTLEGTTTPAIIAANPYPLSEPKVIVDNAEADTLVALFNDSDGLLMSIEKGVDTITTYSEYYQANQTQRVRIAKAGYYPLQIPLDIVETEQILPIVQEANGLPTTTPTATGISVTIHSTPQQLGGLDFSISIVVTDGSSPATIAHYINYYRAQDEYNLLGTLANIALHEAVIPVGTNYETARGQVFGSAGATLKGVRVVDGNGNEIPGFARMQSDNGTYYSPAASYTLTVTNIVSGSRLLLRRTDTQAVIYNDIPGTTFTHVYTHTSDIPVEIVVRKATTSPYYQEWRTTTTLTNSNNTQTANQLSDT